tara:strand:+ start:4235 stop:4966 length:732 start_codon:yes stop_codon:yes gene_type:complete
MENLVDSVKNHGKGGNKVTKLDVKKVLDQKPDYFQQYDAIVFSGGSGNNNKAHDYIIDNAKPNTTIVGVCRGHQYIAEKYGGTVEKLEERQKGKKKVIVSKEHDLFKQDGKAMYSEDKELEMYKDHIQGVTNPGELEVLAYSTVDSKNKEHKDGKAKIAEVVKHKTRNIYGIQAHPEMGGHGTHVLNNILDGVYTTEKTDEGPVDFQKGKAGIDAKKEQIEKIKKALEGKADYQEPGYDKKAS